MTVMQGWMIVVLLLVVVVLLGVLIGVLLARGAMQKLEVVSAPGRRARRPSRPARPSVSAELRKTRPARTDDVIDGVVEFFAVTITRDDLTGPSRREHVVTARHITMRLARELTEDTYQQIGAALNRDHATVMHGCEQAASMAVNDVRETVVARLGLAGIMPMETAR